MISFDDLMDGYGARALLEEMCDADELADEGFLLDVADALWESDHDEPMELGLIVALAAATGPTVDVRVED